MVRGKVHLQKIQDPANRRVTFSKRKSGLLKKATELSVLCESEIALIIFSPSGKLYEFASPRIWDNISFPHICWIFLSQDSMSRIMVKYQKFGASKGRHRPSYENLETLRLELDNLRKEITHLEKNCKHMNGEHLDLLNFKELKCLEEKISLGVRKIRSRKDKISLQYIRSLTMKEKLLKLENANLEKKIGTSHMACHLNIDIMEEVNNKLESNTATQQDLPQTNLNLTLS